MKRHSLTYSCVVVFNAFCCDAYPAKQENRFCQERWFLVHCKTECQCVFLCVRARDCHTPMVSLPWGWKKKCIRLSCFRPQLSPNEMVSEFSVWIICKSFSSQSFLLKVTYSHIWSINKLTLAEQLWQFKLMYEIHTINTDYNNAAILLK